MLKDDVIRWQNALNKRTNTQWKFKITGVNTDRFLTITDGITILKGRNSKELDDEIFKFLKAHGNSRVWRPYL